jgi:hypothetical protein
MLAVATAAAFCLATLVPTASNEALAQGIRVTSNAQSYYNGYGAGYNSGYQNGYGINSYGRYATSGNGYTGYGNGPYGYGSSGMFAYPSAGLFGYSNRTTYGLDYRALRYEGGTYRRIYAPDNTRYYNPYGNLRY